MVGNVHVDSEALVVTSSISKICQFSLSEMFIEVELRMCIHRGDYVCVCDCLRLNCVYQKNICSEYMTECSSAGKVPCGGTYPLGFEPSTRHWCSHFPGFNRRYSFSGRRHARR